MYLNLLFTSWYEVDCWIEKGVLAVLRFGLEQAINFAQRALDALAAIANAFFNALSAVVGIAQGALDLVRRSLEIAKYHKHHT